MHDAEIYLIKFDQSVYYSEVYDYLCSDKNVANKIKNPNLVKQLKLQCVNGIIRSCSRLTHSDLPYESKFPIMLSNSSKFSRLLIEFYHKRAMHTGVNSVMYMIRQKYWMPRGRQATKSVISKCVTCRKVQVMNHFFI